MGKRRSRRRPCEKPGGSQRRLARYHIAIQEQEHGQAAKPSQAMRTNSKERFPPENVYLIRVCF